LIEVGVVNNLLVERVTSEGFFLKGAESEENVFMSMASAPADTVKGIKVDVFVYTDKSDNLVATTRIPKAIAGEYALMSVVTSKEFGAFFDWGFDKDLLVPGNEMKVKVQCAEEHVVRVCVDEMDRVFGTTKLGEFIENSDFDIYEDDKVDICPVQKTDLGYRCIINKKFIGMIYTNEIFVPIEIEAVYQGVVKKIREDGLVDVALQVQGFKNLLSSKNTILEYLESVGGKSDLDDKANPADVKKALGMSKQTFKRVIGMLFKDKKINFTRPGIELRLKSEVEKKKI